MITEKLILPYIVVSGDLVLHASFFVLMLYYSLMGGEKSFIAKKRFMSALISQFGVGFYLAHAANFSSSS